VKIFGQPAKLVAHQIEIDTYDRTLGFFKNLAVIYYSPQTVMRVAIETPAGDGYVVLDAKPDNGAWIKKSIYTEKAYKNNSA
jgi:hypothetical protein